MATDWHARYRRIIDAYRGKLIEVDPKACDEVDDRMWRDPKTRWVADNNPPDLDKLVTAKEISERYGIEVHNIRAWARRHPDKIRTFKEGGKVLFLLREVVAFNS